MVSGDHDTSRNNCIGFNDSELNDFSLGFIDEEPNENIGDGFASSPSFEVVEEIKVNHGMFVSTRQVADTFFHKIVPSQVVKVQVNPAVMAHNLLIEKADTETTSIGIRDNSFLRKLKTFSEGNLFGVAGKFLKPWKEIASTVVCTLFLVLMHCFYVGENMENGKGCASDDMNMKMKKSTARVKGNNKKLEKEGDFLVNIRSSGGDSFIVILKKLGLFLTLSLALCSMWANHVVVST